MKLEFFRNRARRWVLSLLLPAFALLDSPLQANPTGGVVVHGQATIDAVSSTHLQINQQSQATIINWTDFSINAGELTQFVQPNANAIALNRVVGGNVSQIHGQLQGNGNVFVINTNGIFIGSSGVVDIAGNLVLSTLDIDDQDFLNGGPSRFYGNSTTGVTNFGTISSAGGDVILLGGFVDNNDGGQIGALNGTVALGSGGDILLEQSSGGGQITVRGASDYTGTGVNNAAGAEIRGAGVEMKAHGNVYALAINNGGAVRATSASRSGGRVRLQSSGGSGNIQLGSSSDIYARSGADGGNVGIGSEAGTVNIDGVIDAGGALDGGSVAVNGVGVAQAAGSVVSATGGLSGGVVSMDARELLDLAGEIIAESALGDGGDVVLTGNEIAVQSTAEVATDGFSRGGRVRIGGEFQGKDVGLREADYTTVAEGAVLSADGMAGNGGSVIVWANRDTLFAGDVSASALGNQGDGGLIEVSGKEGLGLGGTFSATAVNGLAGTVLFDPGTIQVGNFGAAPGVNQINVALINDTLQKGTSVVLATSGEFSDIIFEDFDLGSGQQAGGSVLNGTTYGGGLAYDDPDHPRNLAIQWTNSDSSFGAFAGGNIVLNNHIRTSGGGSINLVAGWTGDEADFQLGGQFVGGNSTAPIPDLGVGVADDSNPLSLVSFDAGVDVEGAFNKVIEDGQFGRNGGSITVGSATMDRHVEVGSRYGNTNLAADTVKVTGSDENGETRYAQIGFRDSGTVFAPRFNDNTSDGFNFDINLTDNAAGNGTSLVVDAKPLVGIVGREEVDINGDGIMDGVRGINEDGVQGTTYIPYANHYNSSRVGNWWWQQIHEASSLDPNNPPAGVNVTTGLSGAYINTYDANDIGGNRPEMGAGTSLTDRADINIIATGNVEVIGGGRHGSGAQIGHGGDSAGSLEDISRRNSGTINTGNGLVSQNWSFSGSRNDRTANAIGRLAPVYGNINVLAGVNADEGVTRNADGSLNALIDDGGSVLLEGLQRMSSSNNKNNFETNSASIGAPAWIGHGGVGQFGRFIGDIRVEADGDIQVKAGSNSRGFSAIGHHVLTNHDWNPTDVADAQIRFFSSSAQFDIPELRRDAITVTGGTDIASLDGSVINEFRGDINVRANNGDVLVKGYDNDASLNLFTLRDLRFAQIGHGGETAEEQQERTSRVDDATRPSNNFEQVRLRIRDDETLISGGTVSESLDTAGIGGTAINRALTFMTITGDIDVYSSNNLKVSAGNGLESPAMVGHGGHTLADYETSSAIVGDIKVDVGGTIELIGGGEEAFTGVRRDTQQGGRNLDPYGRNFVMIGHGGYQTGFNAFIGDIDVDAVGDITITGGEFRDTFAKIGHQGTHDYGQSGGTVSRSENFLNDGNSTDFTTTVTAANKLTVSYVNVAGGRGPAAADNLDIDISGHTADVSVISSSGDILLNHKGEGLKRNANQIASNLDPTYNQALRTPPGTGTGAANNEGDALVDQVYVQIGHGGIDTDALQRNNDSFNQVNKVGNVEVIATAGNITLENGNGLDRWTRIGHGVGRNDNGAAGGESLQMTGTITAIAGGSIFVNAAAADANGNIGNLLDSAAATTADTSRWNPVAIGHGGAFDNNGLVVLSDGEDVNGITADATITINAGQNLEITGGKGQVGSSAQVGHGYGTTLGNGNNNRVGSVASGFNGDIKVSVGTDLKVNAGANAWVLQELAQSGQAVSVEGAFAAIGNGGFQVDAEANGNVQLYVGGNAEVKAQQRTQSAAFGTGSTPDLPLGAVGSLASTGNFVSVGHFNMRGGGGAINNAAQTGDVTVVVDGNFDLAGGTSNPEVPLHPSTGAGPGVSQAPIVAAFAKVGNGGPGINGDVAGNVTVLVKGDLNVSGGDRADQTTLVGPVDELSNYAQIGNGDRFIGEGPILAAATGFRDGNIVIGVGENATFDDVLIGHYDPKTNPGNFSSGTVTVAVSRNNPFYSVTPGTLTATNDTVFSSGTGANLKLIMPSRSANQMDNTTRLNEGTSTFANYTLPVGAGRDFDSLDGSGTETSGRDDEVFLTPDLWWDAVDLAGSNGFAGSGVFPTDATGGSADQGGSIANVLTPGGFPNLDTLSAGAIGSSATTSSAGNYTLYYDAVEVVAAPALPPTPPPVFDPFPFKEALQEEVDQFVDSFTQSQELLNNEIGGETGRFGGLLGLRESEEFEVEGNDASGLENRLDDLFGPRRDSASSEETEEERRARRLRGRRGVGTIGLTYYAFEPGTNAYSSYQVFGAPAGQLFPAN